MTFLPQPVLVDANYDAFKRLRVSPIQTIFESKLIHDGAPLFWDEELTTGGTTTYNAATSDIDLDVTSTIGSKVVRQTYMRFPYQAGKSSLVLMTGNMGDTAGFRRRIGLFDGSDGLYFEHDGTDLKVVKLNASSATTIAQSAWNIDRLLFSTDPDNSPSGITLNIREAQIFLIDFEWLGVGRVRFGFVIGGQIIYVHEFLHANVLSAVYMTTPNLPLRYEIENISAGVASSLTQICSSISQEGGSDAVGPLRAVDNDTTHINCTSTSTKYGIIGYRQASGSPDAVLKPRGVEILMTTLVANDSVFWELQLRPTFSTTAGLATTQLTNSEIEQLRPPASGAMTVSSDGIVLASGYVSSVGRSSITSEGPLAIWPGLALDGTTYDEIWLTVIPLSSNSDVLGAISIQEVA